LQRRAVIASTRSGKRAILYDDREFCKERNLIEQFTNKIKHYGRIAMRYDNTVLLFAAVPSLAPTMIGSK
jgi:hypothetical protein